jgi:prepilin-type processing-associated H-X9-DG protein
MHFGVRSLPKDGARVAFFDADLTGLRPAHVAQMVAASNQGFDMVCGLRDHSTMRNYAQVVAGPIITGERILRRWVLDRLPLSCWNGYRIEVAMNFTVTRHGGRTALLFLDGVGIVDKLQKIGFVNGLWGQLKMFAELGRTRDALRRTHGGSCAV